MSFPYLAVNFQTHPAGLWLEKKCRCQRLFQLPMFTVVYVLCVVCRLQGDSLSDTKSEEDHRPHVSEQAVPDISCMLYPPQRSSKFNLVQHINLLPLFFHTLLCLSFLPVRVCCLGSAPLPGVDTVAGRLQECEALSQVSASVSILPSSITQQFRSFYSHQLRSRIAPLQPLLS